MKIENDIVTFAPEDFDGLSAFGKRAVTAYLEDYAKHFSNQASGIIALAKIHIKTSTTANPIIDSILTGLASADEEKLKEAEPLLLKLDELLNS